MARASEARSPCLGLALFTAAALAAPSPVRAAEAPEILVLAPEGCADAKEFGAAVRELAGGDFDPRGMRLEVVREEARWRGELTLPGGQRALDGESCAAVMDAAAVVVALSLAGVGAELPAAAFDAGAAASASTGPFPEAAEAAVAAAESTSPSRLAASSSGAARVRLKLRAGVMGEVGLLPAPSLGPRLRVTFERGRYGVDLGAALLLARRAQLSTGESANIYWFAGQAGACRVLHGRLRACLGGEAGRIVGTGSGVDVAQTASGNWLAATADVSFGGGLAAPFSWEAGLGVAAALVLPEFGFDDLGILHRPSSVSGRFFASLGWQ